MLEEALRKLNTITIRKWSETDSEEIEFVLPNATLAMDYFNFVAQNRTLNIPFDDFKVIREAKRSDKNPPFLSIVTRTQGIRIKELNEVMLCLSRQTDTDFELLLVAHNASCENIEKLKGMVDVQSEWFKNRISLLLVEGGTRTRPLNVAISFARGDYFSIFDDDDLVFDNWVSVFHEAAKEYYGTILFSYVYSQIWGKRQDTERRVTLFPKESPKPTYCEDFDYLRQVSVNKCPPVGLAFPMMLFKEFGVSFDETLTTTEDWDFLMRSYSICGVTNTQKPTAVYRFFEGASNSLSVHSDREWKRNYASIQQKLMHYPVLLEPQYYEKLALWEDGYSHYEEISSKSIQLYVNFQENSLDNIFIYPDSKSYDYKTGENIFSFYLDDGDGSDGVMIRSLRFIPLLKGLTTLEDLKIELLLSNCVQKTVSTLDLKYNGISPAYGSIVFLVKQPCIDMYFKRACKADHVRVSYKLRGGVEESMLTGTRIFVRLKEKARRMLKRFRAE